MARRVRASDTGTPGRAIRRGCSRRLRLGHVADPRRMNRPRMHHVDLSRSQKGIFASVDRSSGLIGNAGRRRDRRPEIAHFTDGPLSGSMRQAPRRTDDWRHIVSDDDHAHHSWPSLNASMLRTRCSVAAARQRYPHRPLWGSRTADPPTLPRTISNARQQSHPLYFARRHDRCPEQHLCLPRPSTASRRSPGSRY